MAQANKVRAKMQGMETARLAAERLLELLRQRSREVFGTTDLTARNVQAYLAKETKINRTLVNKLVNDVRTGISSKTVERAASTYRVRREYFYDKAIRDLDYHKHLSNGGPGPASADARAAEQGLSDADIDAMLLDLNATEDERRVVADVRRRHPELPIVPSAIKWAVFARRAGKKPTEAIDGAINASVDNELRRAGRRRVPPANEQRSEQPPEPSKPTRSR